MSRARELQNELTEAVQQIYELKTENRLLKMVEKRLECALSKYEGSRAQLPQIIKSYAEDMRSLQTRLRHKKSLYRELENRHRIQSAELRVVNKDFKHLMDLTKNKQLGEREKLSNQLEKAEYTIIQQEKKIQSLIKNIELQNKTYRNQITVEMKKIKVLKGKMDSMDSLNKKLELNMEKIKYQSFSSKQYHVSGTNHNYQNTSKPNVNLKKSIIDSKDNRVKSLLSTKSSHVKPHKPELVHGESKINNHTKDSQKTLIKQVHEDLINKPNMMINDTSISSSWLDRGLNDVIGVKNLSDDCEENIEELISNTNIDENPFPFSRMKSGISKHLLEDNSSTDDEFLTGANKNYGTEKHRYSSRLISSYNEHDHNDDDDDNDDNDNSDDDDDNDVSSISSVSDSSD